MNTPSQEKLKLKRESYDTWTTREQLCLASSVLKCGDKNWVSVSRSLKPFAEKDGTRPQDWYSQKSCAVQYSLLLENADAPKRKKRDSGETIGESIVKRLTQERIAELTQLLAQQREEYQQLKSEINMLKSGGLSEEKLQKILQMIEQEEREQEQRVKNHNAWLIKRQQKQEVSLTPVSTPKKTPEVSNDFQELECGNEDEKKTRQSELLTTLLKSQSTAVQHQIVSAIGTSPTQVTSPNRLSSNVKVSGIQTSQTIPPQLHQLVASTIASTERPSAGAPTLSMLLSLPANLSRGNLQTNLQGSEESPKKVNKTINQAVPNINTSVTVVTPEISETERMVQIIDQIDEVIDKEKLPEIDKDEFNLMMGDIEELIEKEILNPKTTESTPISTPPASAPVIIDMPVIPEKPAVVEEPIEPPQVIEPIHSPSDSSHSEMAIEEIDQSTTSIAEIIGTSIELPVSKAPEEPKVEIQKEEKTDETVEREEDKKLNDESGPMETEPAAEHVEEDFCEVVEKKEDAINEKVDEKPECPKNSVRYEKIQEETEKPKVEVDVVKVIEEEEKKDDLVPEESEKTVETSESSKEEKIEEEINEEVKTLENKEEKVSDESKNPVMEVEKKEDIPDEKIEEITIEDSEKESENEKEESQEQKEESQIKKEVMEEEKLEETLVEKVEEVQEEIKIKEEQKEEVKEMNEVVGAKSEEQKEDNRNDKNEKKDSDEKDVVDVKDEKMEDEKNEKIEEKKEETKEEGLEKNSEPPKIEQQTDVTSDENSGVMKEIDDLEFKEEPPVLTKIDAEDILESSEVNNVTETEIETLKNELVEIPKLEESEEKDEVKKDEKEDTKTEVKSQEVEEKLDEKLEEQKEKKEEKIIEVIEIREDVEEKMEKVEDKEELKQEIKMETIEEESKKDELLVVVTEEGRFKREVDEVKKEGSTTSLADDTEIDEDESSLSSQCKLNVGKGIKTYSKRQNTAVDSETETETSEGADYRAWKKAVLVVYSRLAAHKYASLFLRPITEDHAPGYHSVIFHPMDLSTIKKNIDNGIIRTTMHFQRDVMLMFQNAIMYNKQDTLVYKMAVDMQEECLQHMQMLVAVTEEGKFKRETRTASSSNLAETSDSSIKRKRSLITSSPLDSDSPRLKKRRKSEND